MIQVLIERRIADGMISTYEQTSRQALHRTYIEQGFISGESFHDMHNPHKRFMICKWRSSQDWHRWYSSEERGKLMNMILPILSEPEKITLLEN